MDGIQLLIDRMQQDGIKKLEQENKQLKEQLAEKETFIKELQRDNRELRKGLNKSGLDYFIKSSNSIRKQVCDEIRKSFDEHRKILQSNYDECIFSMDNIIEELEELEQAKESIDENRNKI